MLPLREFTKLSAHYVELFPHCMPLQKSGADATHCQHHYDSRKGDHPPFAAPNSLRNLLQSCALLLVSRSVNPLRVGWRRRCGGGNFRIAFRHRVNLSSKASRCCGGVTRLVDVASSRSGDADEFPLRSAPRDPPLHRT
jgi:hypothetical protein